MTFFALLFAMLAILVMGFGSILLHPRRGANQAIGLLAFTMLWWLGHNLATLLATESAAAMWNIRRASVAAAWIPVFSHVIRLIIRREDGGLARGLREGWLYLIFGVLSVPLCFSPAFILDIRWITVPGVGPLANPVYGPAGGLYGLYMLGQTLWLMIRARSDRQCLEGLRRVEMDFLLWAFVLSLGLGTLVGLGSNLVLQTAKAVPLTNAAAAMTMVGVIVYGISSRRILEVREGARHLSAGALQVLLLMGAYALGLWLFSNLPMTDRLPNKDLGIHLAALLLAILSNPLQAWILRLEGWIFSRDAQGQAVERLEAIQLILARGATPGVMLRTFEERMARLLDVDHVRVFTLREGKLRRIWPAGGTDEALDADGPLVQCLREESGPLSVDHALRQPGSPLRVQAVRQLRDWGMALAIAIRSGGELDGFILFSPKRGGRLFTDDQLRFAAAGCGQLEIGLKNVELFSRVEAAHRYHQALVHHLASGVLAVDPHGRINVCNQKAEDMLPGLGLGGGQAQASALPEPLPGIYEQARDFGRTPLHEFHLPREGGGTRLTRCVAASFPAGDAQAPGVVLLLDDLTEMRKLEKSLQEKEEMARIGQLAAQMAHEIKNPLQTLHTFFELFPERRNDEAFVTRFGGLAETEVRRIDHIVNRLLTYVRHDKPVFRELSVHVLLRELAAIYELRLAYAPTRIGIELAATADTILGDREQLAMMLDNIIANGIQSMRQGVLTLSTANEDEGRTLRISIRDQGCGISPEDLPHIFDAFFSRKVYGTGLGLVTAKRVAEDHHGRIEVVSEPRTGTVFHISLPCSTPVC